MNTFSVPQVIGDGGLPTQPLLARGQVWHRRMAPVGHVFSYASYFVMLPMRTLGQGCDGLRRNRRGLLSFYDRDHGDASENAVAWLDQLLIDQGITDASGPLWLLTYPRVLGYAFKPVSIWYAYRADHTLAAVVAEVNNTFGERHCYVLVEPSLQGPGSATAIKVFHVSPFCSVAGEYRFQFTLSPVADTPLLPLHSPDNSVTPQPSAGRRITVLVDLYQAGHNLNAVTPTTDALQCLLRTGIAATLSPLTARAARRAFWGVPLMTLMVVVRIHWQALRLYAKRVPFFSKPVPPSQPVTR